MDHQSKTDEGEDHRNEDPVAPRDFRTQAPPSMLRAGLTVQ